MTSVGARFKIRAASDAHTLPRLLNYFAQRGLTPSKVCAEMVEETAFVLIELPSIGLGQALIIAEKMRCSVLTEDVVLCEIP